MVIYLIEILMIFILWPIHKISVKISKRTINGKTLYLFFIFLMFGLTMALRNVSVGSDTQTYNWIYQSIKNSDTLNKAFHLNTISSAPVYVFIQYICSRIFASQQAGTILNSIIVAGGFYYYIRNNSTNYMFSSFLFVGLTLFFESMNGTRQFMAIAFAINAYCFLKKNLKSIKGWILFGFAVGIHNTIVAFIITLIGVIIKKKTRNFEKVFTASVVVSLVIAFAFSFLINIVSKVFPYFNVYLNGNNSAQMMENGGNGRIILLFIFLGVIMIASKQCIKRSNYMVAEVDYVDVFSCFICVVLGMIFSRNILFMRILWPFMCVFLVYLPNMFEIMAVKTKKIMMLGTVFVLSIYSILFLIEDKSSIIPYAFFWSKL